MTPGLPARSLIGAEYFQPERDGEVRVLLICDCGTSTDLTVAIEGALARPREAAFTCDGCQSAHWFTLYPPGSAPQDSRPA